MRLATTTSATRRMTNSAAWTSATGSASRATVITTERGELSVRVAEFELLSKALRALPDKGHGLTDVDTRLSASATST